MISLSRKKILFFIVEGISDYSALTDMLEKIFTNQHVIVQTAQGDITSDKYVTSTNIPKKITDLIKSYYNNSFKPKDFVEIIQLVDMDGAFINPKDIIYDNCDKPIYEKSSIRCKNVNSIYQRNQKKISILNRLISLPTVWGTIPYSVYFFSCNLDHVIHNEANVSATLKNEKASKFASHYKNNPQEFITFFTKNEFSLTDDYNSSWDFIKMDNNSLKRYTNFGLIFTEKSKNECHMPKNEQKAMQ